jgi:para-nitrobenzyl esterase
MPGTSVPGDPTESSEDCLSLNVWTPGIDDRERPVLVWLHGGGFTSGTGASRLYDGRYLAEAGDVVVVTLNYRIGALGFLAHGVLAGGDGGIGNWGLLDQLLALRWVRESIGALGGDPGNVTVFGESAGGMSVSSLMAAPSATGLFHRAIVQSGPPLTTGIPLAERRAEDLAALATQIAGLAAGKITRASLEALPPPALVEAAAVLGPRAARQAGGLPLPLLPVVDGSLLTAPPGSAIAAGGGARVPLLIGTTRDETAFFSAAASLNGQRPDHPDVQRVGARIDRMLGGDGDGIAEAYLEARSRRGEDTSPASVWTAVTTDYVFRIPSIALAEAHAANGSPAFSYLFTWEAELFGTALGSCHALDLPFVFGTLADRAIAPFSGSGPDAVALSRRMQAAWLAFARTGDPSCEAIGEWDRYEPERRPTMVLGADCGMQSDPRSEERKAWVSAGSHPGPGLHREEPIDEMVS